MVDADVLQPNAHARLFRLWAGICFTGGFVSSLVSLLVPRLKILMGLSYTQASLVQLAFHSSYLLFALPITAALVRIGYMRGIAVGLAVMATGCAGLIAATGVASYGAVLVALLTLAGGITFLQIAGNVVMAVSGPEDRAVSRMTLLQGFNSLGTVLGPLVGAGFILGAGGSATTPDLPFLAFGAGFVALALLFARSRMPMPVLERQTPAWRRLGALSARPHMLAAMVAIFCYVGAEVTLATLAGEYVMRPDVIAVRAVTAGHLVSLYWGGAMLGRFGGAFAVKRIGVAPLLASASLAALALVVLAVSATGCAGAGAC